MEVSWTNQHLARNTDDSDAGCENIFDNHGAGTDPDIVRDADSSQDLGALADVHVVPDDGRVVRISSVAADAAVSVYLAVLANSCFRIHNDRTVMLQLQSLIKTTSTNDETEP